MFNFERSIALRKRLGRHCRAGLCYRSAVRGLRYGLRSLQGAVYVEGYAVAPFYLGCDVVYHGWLELPDGTIIDPTAVACHEAFCGSSDTKGWQYFEAWRYFAAMRYTREDLKGVRLNSLPRLWEDARKQSEPHKAAYRLAVLMQAKVRQEAEDEINKKLAELEAEAKCKFEQAHGRPPMDEVLST